MLTAYQTAVQQLIQLVPSGLIPTPTLTNYINTARMQLAGDAECVRAIATLTLAPGVQQYAFSAINVSPSGPSGLDGTISVRLASIAGPLDFRSWEWFSAYYLGNPAQGTPVRLAQHQQGISGSLYFSPIPTVVETVFLDIVGLPIPLVDDTTFDVIPYPWTDAVPFYAAWLAMMQLQRQADAHIMLTRYQELALRGRQEATTTALPDNMPGGPGARVATLKTTLTATPQQPGAGGR